jgi:hypothetical protein
VAANSKANLEKHLAAARLTGLSARELDEAVRLARAVQRRSAEILAEDVTRLLARSEPALIETSSASAGCGPDCACGDASTPSSSLVLDTVSTSAGCGPDCGCGVETAASPTGSQLPLVGTVATATMIAAPAACSCGCD